MAKFLDASRPRTAHAHAAGDLGGPTPLILADVRHAVFVLHAGLGLGSAAFVLEVASAALARHLRMRRHGARRRRTSVRRAWWRWRWEGGGGGEWGLGWVWDKLRSCARAPRSRVKSLAWRE